MFFLFCFLIIAISLSSAAEVISPAEFYGNEVVLFVSCALLIVLVVRSLQNGWVWSKDKISKDS